MTGEDRIGFVTLFTLAAAGFAVGLWIRRREAIVRKWPQAKGRIFASTIIRSPMSRGGTHAEPVIEYEFQHEGRTLRTSHWRVGNFSIGNEDSAQAIISRYPVGSSVTVYINQKCPEKSVLESQPSTLCWVPFGFGILFLAVFSVGLLITVMKHQW